MIRKIEIERFSLITSKGFDDVVAALKAGISQRQVALSTGTIALLNEWMSQLQNRSAQAWLFPAENGTSPLRRDNLWRRNMHPKLTVDVNENEYAVSSFAERLAAVRKLESSVVIN